MRCAFIILLLIGTSISSAGWVLLPQKSELSFVATKDARVADNHYFLELSGFVKDDGHAELFINTESVESHIDKRDSRLRSILFKTGQYPQAKVTLSVRRSFVKPQPPGSQRLANVKANVSILGISLQQSAKLNIVHLADGNVEVSTVEPVLLDTEDYGMLNDIDHLRELAGLKSLSIKIPISFRLIFERESK